MYIKLSSLWSLHNWLSKLIFRLKVFIYCNNRLSHLWSLWSFFKVLIVGLSSFIWDYRLSLHLTLLGNYWGDTCIQIFIFLTKLLFTHYTFKVTIISFNCNYWIIFKSFVTYYRGLHLWFVNLLLRIICLLILYTLSLLLKWIHYKFSRLNRINYYTLCLWKCL